MDSIGLEVFIILSLILLNGFLALSEMAIVSSNRIRLLALANNGKTGARIALNLIESPSKLLASIQIGITLVGVLIGAFGGSSLSTKVGNMVTHPLNIGILNEYSEGIGLTLVVVISTFLSLIIGELVPKRMALAHPESTASKVAPVIRFISILSTPGVKILAFTTESVLKLFRLQNVSTPQVTEEEVKLMVEQGTEAGVFDAGEETIIKRSLRLGSLSAADVMTPRTKVVCFDISNYDSGVVLEKVRSSKHTYFPVYNEQLDNIVGLLSAKLMLYAISQGQHWDLRDCLIEPLMVPESVSVIGVLESFKDKSAHVAIVIDEYGGMAGMLTIIDMMEAIVGALPHEADQNSHRFVRREDGSMLVDGMTSMHEFEEYFKVSFRALTEGEDIQTIAGLLMQQMGRIPREGDVLQLENLRIEVVDMDGRRVDKILVYTLSGEAMAPHA
ncbi:MAG: HlyC/CorC family transporter [Oligoflexus sp.]|nr:HlyC/CorC family transporter [Oligoflexus sp.]